MSKAILVIDMPQSCGDCPLFEYSDICMYCAANDIMANENYRLKDCPLKPMPQELPTPYMMRQIQIANGIQTEKPPYTEEYQKGYNDCLREILGETDDRDI